VREIISMCDFASRNPIQFEWLVAKDGHYDHPMLVRLK